MVPRDNHAANRSVSIMEKILSSLFIRCLHRRSTLVEFVLLVSMFLVGVNKMFTTDLDALEVQVYKALYRRSESYSIVNPSKPPYVDIKATKFFLSPGRPLYASLKDFSFRPFSQDDVKQSDSWSALWDSFDTNTTTGTALEYPDESTVDRIICHLDRSYKNINLWQHYVHLLFPCWSLFQRYPKAIHIVDVHDVFEKVDGQVEWAYWTRKLNYYYRKAGIQFVEHPQYLPSTMMQKRNQIVPRDWIAFTRLHEDGKGFGDPEGMQPFENSYYFMNADDIYLFQQQVLGKKYRYGPSLLKYNERRKLKIAILNRESGSTREWFYSPETRDDLAQEWGSVLDVEYTDFHAYTFEDQAMYMHDVDVVITPHGAQLTNAVFMRPCTVVLELLPDSFYHPKKGPLVMEVGGIYYTGYRFEGSPRAETSTTKDLGTYRDVRSMNASAQSIEFAMPDLLQDALSCRKQWTRGK